MDNLRGSLLMTLAMLGFAVEDVLIKLLSARYDTGQIIAVIGIGGAVVLAALMAARGQPIWSRDLLTARVLVRSACEGFGAAAFVYALSIIDLTTASAVIQATPLVVAMGGALFLGQRVGWRRWTAISVGLAGVLLILRPGLDGFQPATLWAVVGMLCLALRDLVTRTLPSSIASEHLTLGAFAALAAAGVVLTLALGTTVRAMPPTDAALMALTIGIGLIAYFAIVGATRIGDVALISSFRYARMVFALILGALVFTERPDAATLIGAAIIIAAGIYALLRETRTSQTSSPALHQPKGTVSANIFR